MPQAQQPPLGNFGDVLKGLDERARSSEQDRLTWQGQYTPTAAPFTSSTGTMTAPPGWSTFTFTAGAGGVAMVVVQVYAFTSNPSTSFGFYIGGSVDGGTVGTWGSGGTDTTPPGAGVGASGFGLGLQVVAGLQPYSTHTALIYVALEQAGIATATYENPLYVAKSF